MLQYVVRREYKIDTNYQRLHTVLCVHNVLIMINSLALLKMLLINRYITLTSPSSSHPAPSTFSLLALSQPQ